MENKKKRESRQPRETISKLDFKCICGKKVRKDDTIWYDPIKRIALCMQCNSKKIMHKNVTK